MKLIEYIEKARTTALYPDLGNNIYYPTLGLAGECAEVYDKVYFEATEVEIIKELGDVCWYIANLITELKINVDDLTINSVDGDALQLCGMMVISTGVIAECVKKTMRDSGGVMPDEKRSDVIDNIGMIIAYVDAIATIIGSSIDEVTQTNIDKLFSRKERGVIKGDGDNR